MNKISAITSYLGANRSRYIDYQPERSLADKCAVAQQAGLDGLELCYPADFSDLAALRARSGRIRSGRLRRQLPLAAQWAMVARLVLVYVQPGARRSRR